MLKKIVTHPAFFALAFALIMIGGMHVGLIDSHTAALGLPMFLGTTSAFQVNPTLTAVAIGYQNPDVALIAENVMPSIPTAKRFSYTKYSPEQGFTVPNTNVGRKSEPNMVDFGGTLVYDEVKDYGLDDLVTNDDIQAYESMPKPPTGGPIDPMSLSTMMLTGLVQLDREVRVAGTVFNASNFAAANQSALAGTSQWSDYVNSNPLFALLAAIDSCLVRPNTLTIGQQGWTVLRQHPKIVQAVFKTVQGAGTIPREALAELLEIQNINIGQAFVNTARKGQAPNYQRAWGKHLALTHTSSQAAQLGQPTWGFSANWGSRIAGVIPEPKAGLRGGQRVRSGESRKEVVCAPDAGYLFQNIVA